MYYLYDAFEMIRRFMESGGQVLWGVAIATFLLWVFTIIPVNRAERRAGGRDNSNPRQAQQLLVSVFSYSHLRAG